MCRNPIYHHERDGYATLELSMGLNARMEHVGQPTAWSKSRK